VQLRTRTKAFCACATSFGAAPNTNVCPVCLGLPGALPVLSREALLQAIRGGLGFGCEVAATTRWDRKNYLYPDLPKGFQITQVAHPLCTGGSVAIDSPTRGSVEIAIDRAHLEEDTGKLVHGPDGRATIDFDRAGTPLLEIVTRPVIESADEASRCLEEIRRVLRHLGVSDCDMEKGRFRCEPNVNVLVRDADGSDVPTPIVELKNLNSFAHARNAIEHERVRQVEALLAGGRRGPRPKETRGWDEERRATYVLRAKEDAADYRYFAEPDLPPVTIAARLADEIRASLPELPRARRRRYVETFGLAPADAASLADERPLAEWFDEAVRAAGGDAATARAVARWTTTDVRRELNARGGDLAALPVTPRAFGEFVAAVLRSDLPREAAKAEVFPAMAASGRGWREVAAEKGIAAVTDEALVEACRAAIAARPEIVASFRAGRKGVKGVLVGEVLEATRRAAEPRRVAEILERLLLPPSA
jgi:aspartyl-tRNA(Asn)/glutamyl-tRNA(Gln) amidotransferase subunit B